MTVSDLHQRCLASTQDNAAWQELRQLVERAALWRVTKAVRDNHLGLHRVADILQDFYLHLQKDAFTPLKAFRGTTEPQLRSFLGTAAYHFAVSWVRKEKKRRTAEQHALRDAPQPARDGPTESVVDRVFLEVQSRMPPGRDREKLKFVSPYVAGKLAPSEDYSPPVPSISQRTLQQWRRDLVRKYADEM